MGIPKCSVATDYNEDISEGIPALAFWYGMMNLNSGENVHLDLHVTGSANFYFMDSSNFANYQASQSGSYLVSLSQEHTNAIDLTAQVPYAGTWYVVVANTDGLNSLSLTGHISAFTSSVIPPSDVATGFAGILSILAVVALIIVVVVIVVVLTTRKPRVVVMQYPQSAQWRVPSYPDQRAFCEYCGAPATPGAMACHRCGRRFLRNG